MIYAFKSHNLQTKPEKMDGWQAVLRAFEAKIDSAESEEEHDSITNELGKLLARNQLGRGKNVTKRYLTDLPWECMSRESCLLSHFDLAMKRKLLRKISRHKGIEKMDSKQVNKLIREIKPPLSVLYEVYDAREYKRIGKRVKLL